MKKFIVSMLLLALLAFGASALQITDVKLGDDSTERGARVSKDFTITNNGATTVTNIQFSHTGAVALNLTFTNVPAQLLAGASAQVTVTGTIPASLDSVNEDLQEVAINVATMTATATEDAQQVTASANVQMQAENKLVINDLTFVVNSDSQGVSDGDKIDGILPGDSLELSVQVENKFKDNEDEDFDINDVEVRILIDDNDFDVDEEEDVDDLSAEDEDEVSFDFDVDDDVDDKTFTLEIFVSGRDENGALHGEKNDLRLSVERETHDITIRRAELQPATLACGETDFRASVTVSNFGKRDEDAAAVEIVSPQLKINKKLSDIELDEDRSRTEAFDLSIPAGTKPGSYRLDVNTFFDNVARSRNKALFLAVEACEQKPVDEPVVEKKPVPKVEVVPPAPIVQPPVPKVTPRDSFQDSAVYLAVLGGLSALLFVIIVVLLVVFLARRRA